MFSLLEVGTPTNGSQPSLRAKRVSQYLLQSLIPSSRHVSQHLVSHCHVHNTPRRRSFPRSSPTLGNHQPAKPSLQLFTGKDRPETRIIHLNIHSSGLTRRQNFIWWPSEEELYTRSGFGEEMEQGEGILVAGEGLVAICLLGFANWSNGYGVRLHLSVHHPLWSLEKNTQKLYPNEDL